MGKFQKGSAKKGAPIQGNWGDRHIIVTPPVKRSNVSCLTCKNYSIDDKSCSIRSIGPGDGIDHWKKCNEFILDIGFDTYDNRVKVQQIRGVSFYDQMIQKIAEDREKANKTASQSEGIEKTTQPSEVSSSVIANDF